MQESKGCDGLIARAANRHLGKSDREASGVLSSAQRHTHFPDSPRMKRVLERSDFQFIDLKQGTQSVFLVLPPDRLATLCTVAAIETAELVARLIGKRDAHYMTASYGEGKQTNSQHIAARNLINADEIMRLPDDRMILLLQGHYPAKLNKIRYYEDKEFKGLFERI